MQLNTDMLPIKSLYFESGSKRLESGEEYSGVHGKFSIVKWWYFIHLGNISLKLSKYVYFMLLSHSTRSQYKYYKNLFL